MMKITSITCLAAVLGVFSQPVVAQQGEWEDFFPFGIFLDPTFPPISTEHLVHVYDGTQGDGTQGKFMALAEEVVQGPSDFCPGLVANRARIYLWTPPLVGSPPGSPGTFEDIRLCRTYNTCSGHTALADGRVLFVGVAEYYAGYRDVNMFDPLLTPATPSSWNVVTPPDTAWTRWYPTCTTLPDGRVMAFSGRDHNGNVVGFPELYDPVANTWTELSLLYRIQDLYPAMFVLPDGNLVDAGRPSAARILIAPTGNTGWAWGAQTLPNPTWPNPAPTPPGDASPAVMYQPGKVMKCGGAWPPWPRQLRG